MIRLVYIGENKDFSDYSMRYGDIYEFDKKSESSSTSYLVIQVRNGVKTVIGLFALPLEEHKHYFISLAEWREQQIKIVLDD